MSNHRLTVDISLIGIDGEEATIHWQVNWWPNQPELLYKALVQKAQSVGLDVTDKTYLFDEMTRGYTPAEYKPGCGLGRHRPQNYLGHSWKFAEALGGFYCVNCLTVTDPWNIAIDNKWYDPITETWNKPEKAIETYKQDECPALLVTHDVKEDELT